MRQISKLCLLSCLALGGWHNVLAAVACAHFECQSAAAAATPSSQASHTAHAAPPRDAARETSHCGARAESSGHAHAGAAAHGRAEVARRAGATRRGDDANLANAVPVRADAARPSFAPAGGDCLHCAGRPAPPQATVSERRADEPRRVSHFAPHTSHAVGPTRTEWSSAARPAPTRHAPPRTVSQHLLFGVFLI